VLDSYFQHRDEVLDHSLQERSSPESIQGTDIRGRFLLAHGLLMGPCEQQETRKDRPQRRGQAAQSDGPEAPPT
jgi:hypothetical protein